MSHRITAALVLVCTITCTAQAESSTPAPGCCAKGGMTIAVRSAGTRANSPASIIDFAFTGNVVVSTGDTVTWTNQGAETHTVTSDTDVFNSGPLEHGTMFSFTFSSVGTFPYHCSIHTRMTSQIRVVPPGTVAINSELTAVGTVGTPFSYTITSLGATPLTFTATNLPPNLTLNGATISGTPTVSGTIQVGLSASNSTGSDSQMLTLLIQPSSTPLAPTITSPSNVTAKAGQSFAYTITATGDPTSLTAAGLPSGLVLSGAQISGVPVSDGTFPITLTAANSAGSATQTLNLTVLPTTSSNSGIDANGNGIPDELEPALTVLPASATQPLTITAVSLSLKFNGADALTLSGTLPLTAGSGPIVIDVGGIVRSFKLDANGNGTSGTDNLKFSSKTGKFTLKVKGTLAPQFADESLTPSKVKAVTVEVPIFVAANNQLYSTTVALSYSFSGKAGRAAKKK